MGEEDVEAAPSNAATSSMPVVLRAAEDKKINIEWKKLNVLAGTPALMVMQHW